MVLCGRRREGGREGGGREGQRERTHILHTSIHIHTYTLFHTYKYNSNINVYNIHIYTHMTRYIHTIHICK